MRRFDELTELEDRRRAILGDGGVWLFDDIRVAASNGGGWDHLAVSCPDRTPTWEEMERVKRMFFRDDETAIQIHPPTDDYVNVNPYCLHLWRKQGEELERPPAWRDIARAWGLDIAALERLQRHAAASKETDALVAAVEGLPLERDGACWALRAGHKQLSLGLWVDRIGDAREAYLKKMNPENQGDAQ